MSDDEIRLSMTVPVDSDGFLRRECPTCERQFKWLPSDDEDESEESAVDAYFCPYCAISAPLGHWATPAQVELAEAITAREVMGPMFDQFERSGFKVERNIPDEPTLSEDDDMRRVDFECHPSEPVKVLDEWTGPVHCLICGQPAG